MASTAFDPQRRACASGSLRASQIVIQMARSSMCDRERAERAVVGVPGPGHGITAGLRDGTCLPRRPLIKAALNPGLYRWG